MSFLYAKKKWRLIYKSSGTRFKKYLFFFFLFFYIHLKQTPNFFKEMLSQGLSHIIFNASNHEDFQLAIKFYTSLGFKDITAKEQQKESVVWLKLSSESQADVIIKLVFNISAIPQHKPAGDVDWALEEASIAFSINDIDVSYNLIDKINKLIHSIINFFFLFRLSKLNYLKLMHLFKIILVMVLINFMCWIPSIT